MLTLTWYLLIEVSLIEFLWSGWGKYCRLRDCKVRTNYGSNYRSLFPSENHYNYTSLCRQREREEDTLRLEKEQKLGRLDRGHCNYCKAAQNKFWQATRAYLLTVCLTDGKCLFAFSIASKYTERRTFLYWLTMSFGRNWKSPPTSLMHSPSPKWNCFGRKYF